MHPSGAGFCKDTALYVYCNAEWKWQYTCSVSKKKKKSLWMCDSGDFYTSWNSHFATFEAPNPQTRFIGSICWPLHSHMWASESRERKREAKVRFNRVKFSPSPWCIALCSQLTELAWQPDLANLFSPIHHWNTCTRTHTWATTLHKCYWNWT